MDKRIDNKFWLLRSKHGRDKIFKSPQILAEACMEYFEITHKRRLNKVDFRGKELEKVEIPHPVPFTITGLCIFLDITRQTWLNYKDKKDFFDICTRVEQIIYNQKFEYAATGFFNANIIARDLGLKEKTDITTNDKDINLIEYKHEVHDYSKDKGDE